MRIIKQGVVFGLLMFLLIVLSSCANKNNAAGDSNNLNSEGIRVNQLDGKNFSSVNEQKKETTNVPFRQVNGTNYVPLRDLINVLQFQSDWNPNSQTLRLGDNDVEYSITANSGQAQKDKDSILLSGKPVILDDNLYFPVSDLADLFQEDMHFELQDHNLVIHGSPVAQPSIEEINTNQPQNSTDDGLDFADDPTAVDIMQGMQSTSDQLPGTFQATATGTGLKNIDMNALVTTAKRYLGVKYLFGAAPYPQSKRFDCSSFTQYVFGKYGVRLNRTARAQAREGVYVSRKMLRKGDLLFFYVPGRFKSNKTVGHNGIYIGNGQMIHTIPSPTNGVQITNINKPYWKRVFITARRVAY